METEYHYLKVIAAGVIAWLFASLSACGVSTPGGYVAGTSSYLDTYYRGQSMEATKTPQERENRYARGGKVRVNPFVK